jgi:prepilin peptidase CpaA
MLWLMTAEFVRMLLILALAALLITAAHTDIIAYRIPNKVCLAIALLAPTYWILDSAVRQTDLITNVAYHLLVAGSVFTLFFIGFVLNKIGGGDVKLLGAIALWAPLDEMFRWLVFMSLAGGLMALFFAYKIHFCKQRRRYFRLRYGVAIAAGGIAFISQPFLKTLTLT